MVHRLPAGQGIGISLYLKKYSLSASPSPACSAIMPMYSGSACSGGGWQTVVSWRCAGPVGRIATQQAAKCLEPACELPEGLSHAGLAPFAASSRRTPTPSALPQSRPPAACPSYLSSRGLVDGRSQRQHDEGARRQRGSAYHRPAHALQRHDADQGDGNEGRQRVTWGRVAGRQGEAKQPEARVGASRTGCPHTWQSGLPYDATQLWLPCGAACWHSRCPAVPPRPGRTHHTRTTPRPATRPP